jgi:RHS repeat-associated protein
MTGMAVSVCLTPAAPSPLPIPYPTVGTSGEGIIDECLRTKINGAKVLTVGGCLKACHGNEAGTLKEVVSLNTAGPCFPALGAPIVFIELGMAAITGSIGQMNKSITVGASGSASGAGGGAGGGGGGSGAGGGPSGGNTQGPGGGGGNGGGDNEGADSPDAPAPPGAEGQASGGHPIDVVTGAMYGIPADDFRLFGPSVLQWVRFYQTSSVGRRCGIGWGWSHSYAWRARVAGDHIEVIDPQGTPILFPNVAGGELAVARFGRRLWWDGDDLVIASDDKERRVLRRDDAGMHRLAEVHDRSGNVISVKWEDGALCRLIDSVGRVIEREKLPNGERWYYLLDASDGKAHSIHAVSYELDERGDLVRVTDEGGAVTEYRYDDQHYMVEERLPSGLVYYFRYEDGRDNKRRCVETWGELPGRDILSEIGHGQRLCPPDIRGLHHTRLAYDPNARTTVLTDAAMGVHRYEGNEHGLVTRYVDPMGRRTTYRYDRLARLVAFTDGLGNVRSIQYDALGRHIGCVNPLGHRYRMMRNEAGQVTTLEVPGGYQWHMLHDGAGRIIERTNPLGVTDTCSYDDRGLVVSTTTPNGSDSYTYDAHGNLKELTTAAGVTCRYVYDVLGRPVSVEGPDEARRFAIDYDSYGHPVQVTAPEEGRQITLADPDGHTIAEEQGGKRVDYDYVGGVFVGATRPDGSSHRLGRDAMGRIHWVENAAGERYWLERDQSGLVVRERTFAGLEYGYDYDAAGQLVHRKLPSGAWERYHRDAAGWIHAVERSDGRVDRFERDARGYVTRASNSACSITLDRDGLGRVTREVQSTGGWEFVVEHVVDPKEPGETHRYSSGWSVTIDRGLYSSLQRIAVHEGEGPPSEVVDFEHDHRFLEVARRRAGRQDAITTERDVLGRPTAITVTDEAGSVVRRRSYRWSRFGLVELGDEHGSTRSYELDELGRPRTVQGMGLREGFGYSDHGTPLPEGASVALGAGGRITRLDDTHYRWDAAGRLAARDVSGRAHESWQFEYGADNRLVKAVRGDGYEITNLYDPFGRRLATIGNDGRSTWFGWDASCLVEEQTTGGRRLRRIYDDADEYTPLAESSDGEWRLVAADAVGTPWFYLGKNGKHAELDLTTWGRVAQSQGDPGPLRLPGQRADEATGLHYNRHRFYLPELAQFATPDPIVSTTLQDVGYVSNPTVYVDPFGLIIIMGTRQQDGLDAELTSARDARRREGEQVIFANQLFNPQTGKGVRLDQLPPGERVEIISHGSAGQMRFGKSSEIGQTVGKKLKDAKLPDGQEVTVISCNAGTTPNAGHPDGHRSQSGQSVVDGIHQATGGQNPVTGVSANPGTRAGDLAGVAVVRPGVPNGAAHQRPHAPGPGPGREDGTVDVRDGHWVRAEGGQPATQVPTPGGMGDPGPGR